MMWRRDVGRVLNPSWVGRALLLVAAAAGIVLLGGCGEEPQGDQRAFRLAVLPDEDPELLSQKYQAITTRLADAMSREVELLIPETYGALVDDFVAGDVDLAYFGGLTFLLARDRAGAEPIVMRDTDARFTTVFIARADDERRSLDDFAGADAAFGSELSTSGHLMPRHFLARDFSLVPEDHFGAVHYSGAHDRTITWVLEGAVDLGMVNSQIYRRLMADGTTEPEVLRVVYETPIYSDYVFAVPPDLPAREAAMIRSVFLDLSASRRQDREILGSLGATHFLPAHVSRWSDLAAISVDRGILRGR